MRRPGHKIALSGAFSTGKTSLVLRAAPQLEAEGIAVAVVGDVAREAPMPLHRDQTPSASAWLVGTQIARESEAQHSAADIVLCDRAIFDVLSHTLLIEAHSDRERQQLRRVWEIGAAWASSYDLVLTTTVNPEKPSIADGVRVADDVYRKQLDDSLGDVLQHLGMERNDLPAAPQEALDATLAKLREIA